MLQVQLIEAHAHAVAVESHGTAIAEALEEAKNHHTEELKDAFLVTRGKRRLALHR